MRPSQIYKTQIDAGALSIDPAQQNALPALDAVYDYLTTPRKTGFFGRPKKSVKPHNVYLWGPVGRGKTLLLDMLCQGLPTTVKTNRVHFHAFMLDIQSRLTNLRQTGGSDDYLGTLARDLANEYQLLCFDEFHVTNIADAMILGPLFKALFGAGICVVTTSNWPPNELYQGGLQRVRFMPFIHLIASDMQVVAVMGAQDYRTRALGQSGCYLTDGGASFSDLFKHLSAGLQTHHTPIAFAGRTLPVVAQAGDVVWCTFDETCGQARGASDYLALADAARVILIAGIPQLTDARRDWAKRFMTLVDILYDNRRLLILGATTPLDTLYVGDDLGFEFARTHSRLVEMNTPAYIAQNQHMR